MTADQPTVFQLGRMGRTDLVAEYCRITHLARSAAQSHAEMLVARMTNEAIVTAILTQRERVR